MNNDEKRREFKRTLEAIMETLDCTIDYFQNEPLVPVSDETRQAKLWATKAVKSYLEPLYLVYEKVGEKA